MKFWAWTTAGAGAATAAVSRTRSAARRDEPAADEDADEQERGRSGGLERPAREAGQGPGQPAGEGRASPLFDGLPEHPARQPVPIAVPELRTGFGPAALVHELEGRPQRGVFGGAGRAGSHVPVEALPVVRAELAVAGLDHEIPELAAFTHRRSP